MQNFAKIFLIVICGLFLFCACSNNDEAAPSAGKDTADSEKNQPVKVEVATEKGPDQPAITEETSASEAVAWVNDAPIYRHIFESQVQLSNSSQIIFQKNLENSDKNDEIFRLKILTDLINFELACQEALKDGYGPTEEELAATLQQMEKDFENPNHLYDILSIYGTSPEEFKDQTLRNLALSKWRDAEFTAKTEITDEEIKNFYEAHKAELSPKELVRLSHIFIAVDNKGGKSSKSKALAIAQEAWVLTQKEPFEKVALAFSQDPSVVNNGGDLGWMTQGQGLPDLEKKYLNLKEGQISDVIESETGYHIFKVTGRKAAGGESFDEVKDEIRDYLLDQKVDKKMEEIVNKLRKKAKIEILDPELKAAYAKMNRN